MLTETNYASRPETGSYSGHSAALPDPPLADPAREREAWEPLLADFLPIHLAQMNNVALLNRVEDKFMLRAETLARLLPALSEHYFVLEVTGRRLSRYRTLYFDTKEYALYRSHHAGLRNRYKVRSRAYLESEAMFLEIKHKTNKKRTIKHRVQTPTLVTWLNDANASLLHQTSPYEPGELYPALWNHYSRITLVNRRRAERVTLDLDLRFAWQEETTALPGVSVAEVKRAQQSQPSEFMELMRQHHVRSTGFSKYCVGLSLLSPEVKYNKFKAKHRQLAKLVGSNGNWANGGWSQTQSAIH